MQLSFGLYVFSLLFLSTKCRLQYLDNDGKAHEYELKASNCWAKEFRNEIVANKENALVRPHKMHVQLIPEAGCEYDPSVALVSRCSGQCQPGRVAAPTRSEMVSFLASRICNGKIANQECVHIRVANHTMCKCMCELSADDCEANQNWLEDMCECKCKPKFTAQKHKCMKIPRMEWDARKCACMCKNKARTCMNGNLTWSEEDCDCVYRPE